VNRPDEKEFFKNILAESWPGGFDDQAMRMMVAAARKAGQAEGWADGRLYGYGWGRQDNGMTAQVAKLEEQVAVLGADNVKQHTRIKHLEGVLALREQEIIKAEEVLKTLRNMLNIAFTR
jgi:hypothetical protein